MMMMMLGLDVLDGLGVFHVGVETEIKNNIAFPNIFINKSIDDPHKNNASIFKALLTNTMCTTQR